MTDDRGQVETFGFSTIFGVVALMILIVTLTVLPAIGAVEENQQVGNVERGMVALSDNIDDIARNDASSRSTRVRLDRGQLTLGAPANLSVSGTNGSDSFSSQPYEFRPIVYRSGQGTRLIYANGAVLRAEDGGVAVIDEPQLVVSDKSVVLSVISLQQGDGPNGVSGTARVVTTRTERNVFSDSLNGDVSVSVTVNSTRAVAWGRILEAQGMSCSPPSSNTVTCSVSTDRVYVSLVEVEVAFR